MGNYSYILENINFKVQRNCANTGKIASSVSFHQYFQAFHTKFKIFFRHLVLSQMIFLRRYLKQSHRRLQYDVNNLATKFLSEILVNFFLIPHLGFSSKVIPLKLYLDQESQESAISVMRIFAHVVGFCILCWKCFEHHSEARESRITWAQQ